MGETINIFDKQRVTLSKAVNKTALALLGHMKAGAFLVKIPHTDPQLYVAAGTAEEIRALLAGKNGKERDCLDG